MKTLILFALLQVTVSVPEYFSTLVIEATGATIERQATDKDGSYIIAKVDSYYSEELLKMQVRSTIDQFSDVKVHRTWTRVDGGIRLMVKTGDDILLIEYDDVNKLLTFAWL